ncbi:hypothetical protein THAOC_01084 [Thalassiosira oceanica]|uniref:Protein kinase domain-containing protein n=1 Tax=Thalassiosira oceanica TaxID=159749 RepID=K0TR35_THAOC|nr:hypothetical protein THAOC_01084 [Thalassiosira oceanica]|eukprot:EJK77107.1 hypothetical protein THAOC_01084 [Thalassiosira oceanica]
MSAIMNLLFCERCSSTDEQDRYMPTKPQHYDASRTLSASTTTTAESSAAGSYYSAQHNIDNDFCPVTGVCSNIVEDYLISPNVLGKGHYGVVRECQHRVTGESFAVKSIDKSKVGRLDHLQREIYLLANVDHPSIMKMSDCYEDADYIHIVTEKYTGGELFDQIVESTSQSGCFSERRAAGIIRSLLEAVAYLHENGIVHRDIKPENILFESREQDSAIRLIDFGLSRTHDPKLEGPLANPVGTAYYMSPEVLKGKYDRACDLWAIGVVCYILLCGYPPFNGGTDAEIHDSTRRGRLQFAGVSSEARPQEEDDGRAGPPPSMDEEDDELVKQIFPSMYNIVTNSILTQSHHVTLGLHTNQSYTRILQLKFARTNRHSKKNCRMSNFGSHQSNLRRS